MLKYQEAEHGSVPFLLHRGMDKCKFHAQRTSSVFKEKMKLKYCLVVKLWISCLMNETLTQNALGFLGRFYCHLHRGDVREEKIFHAQGTLLVRSR